MSNKSFIAIYCVIKIHYNLLHSGAKRLDYVFCIQNLTFLLHFLQFKNKVTLMCLSIGTPKTINFPFVPNGKLMVLGVHIFEHIIWL